ncbi:MAG TPA: HEPN domain-containing protein [Segetibacter sp.]|jgi:HEPN domain-containing protein
MEDSKKIITPRFSDEIKKFFSDHPAKRLSRNLRRMLLDCLMDQLDLGPEYFEHLLWDIYYLFELLDVAERETKGWQFKKDFKAEDLYEEGEEDGDENVPTMQAGAASNTTGDTTLKSNGISGIINFIVAAIQPERIFIVSPQPVSDHNAAYIDLLVIIADTCLSSFKEYETIIKLACINYSNVHFSIHQSNVIAAQISEGHIFYSVACTRENLVYDNGKAPLTVAPTSITSAVKEKAIHHFTTAFARAQSFLASAKHHVETGEKEMAAFMLHQAAELTFRAVAMGLLGNSTRSHSLKELKKLCRRCAPQLNDILPANNEYEEELLNLLDRAYLNARYADAYEVNEKHLETLLQRVSLLQATAKQICDEKMLLL